MQAIILSDFGSTYTKVCAVDPVGEQVLGTASAYTTVETDIINGFHEAMQRLEAQTGPLEVLEQKACSSAAGGLRMAVAGLVPDLTAKAAKLAALGAGAKVIRVFDHDMMKEDFAELDEIHPDIFLLTGGTDGGNKACILHNARGLAKSGFEAPIIVAGNRSANDEIEEIFTTAGLHYTVCPNVMPRLGSLAIDEVRDHIREVFLHQIVQAKGLSHINEMISNIILPTPLAMLSAMKLLARGYGEETGIGELMAVDPGGATTDVYSIAEGAPLEANTVIKGLIEPYEKRTVEGDIGMRYSLFGILEAAGLATVAQRAGLPEEEVLRLSKDLREHTDKLPENEAYQRLDDALAASAIEVAFRRHCGMMEEVYTPVGLTYAQTGKDLRTVTQLVLTGGALIHSPHPREIARFAQWSEAEPLSLRPRHLEVLVDRRYLLSAMGVLAEEHPLLALRLMKKELKHE